MLPYIPYVDPMGYGKAPSVWVVLPPTKWALLIQGAANPGAGSRSAAAQDKMIGSTVAR